MAKDRERSSQQQGLANFLSHSEASQRARSQSWDTQMEAVAARFNQEYRREAFDLPPEVEEMPIYQEWMSGILASRIASPFWDLAKPKKNQRCLDLGCGISFLIYPWREWDAYFYGQEVSMEARDILNARGPQLNSKLFKGVKLAGAHELTYDDNLFDLVVATGWSCYYPLDYWGAVLEAVKRVLKPDGAFVFDVLDPDSPIAENWAILETYLGAEVFLESLADWEKRIKAAKGRIIKKQPGELFQLYKIRFE